VEYDRPGDCWVWLTITQTIMFHLLMKWLLGSNLSQLHKCVSEWGESKTGGQGYMLVFLMVIFVQPMGASQRILYDLYKTLGILCCFLTNTCWALKKYLWTVVYVTFLWLQAARCTYNSTQKNDITYIGYVFSTIWRTIQWNWL